MNDTPKQTQEQTLGDFLRQVWNARTFILTGTAAALLLALAFLWLAIPHYRASLTLSPARPMAAAALSQNTADVRNNASASTAAQSDMPFTQFQTVMKGASVAALLLRDDDIAKGLEHDRAFIFSQAPPQWNPARLADYIARRVTVDPVGETPLRTLSYAHPDPAFATLFLKRLHETTDGLIRHAVRRDVSQRIHYLDRAQAEAQNPEHRRTLTDLLMEQERLKMLVSIDQPYAALIVEPAFTQARTVWPDPALILSAFAFCGALAGFALFSLKEARKNQSPAVYHSPRLKNKTRKMREWVRRDNGNNNEPPFSASNAAE